jgi:hypothetical protein
MALERITTTGGAVVTSLVGNITNSSMSFTLAADTGWPTGSASPLTYFVTRIDRFTASEEKILCSLQSGAVVTVVTRGYDGTTAVAHASGAVVDHVVSAQELDDLNDHVYTTTRDDHTQYLRTDGTRAGTGNQTLGGNVTVTGALTVDSNATIDGNLTVDGTFAPATVTTTGNVVVGGTLTSDGTFTAPGGHFTAGLTIAGGATIAEDGLQVVGTLTASGAATLSSSLAVSGIITSGGAVVPVIGSLGAALVGSYTTGQPIVTLVGSATVSLNGSGVGTLTLPATFAHCLLSLQLTAVGTASYLSVATPSLSGGTIQGFSGTSPTTGSITVSFVAVGS